MKKIIDKLFVLLMVGALVLPTSIVFAEGENPDTSPSPTDPSKPSESPDSTPKPTPSDDPAPTEDPKPVAELQSLSIDGLGFEFSKTQYTYSVVAKSDVDTIHIKASAANDVTVNIRVNGSKINGTQASLKEGSNTIEVTAVAGTYGSKTYKVTVTRATSDLSLKSLRIQGQSLNEAFEPNVLNYTADIPYNMESIVIQAGANNKGATFQVLGNTNLKVGNNTVRIVVKNEAGETQEYRINVTRAKDETTDEDDNIDDDDDTNGIESSETKTSQIVTPSKDENPNKGNTLKYILVVVFCLILLIVGGIGIYFYIRTGDNEKRKQKRLEKLQKKQEKLKQELTEESAIISNEAEEVAKEENEGISEIDNFEDTIELKNVDMDEEETIEFSSPKKTDKNVLEDFDDLFLDE